MKRIEFSRRRWSRLAGWMLAATSLGCQGDRAMLTNRCCQDIPPGAVPRPVGTHACEWQTQQMQRAEIDDFVIYQHEWRDNSTVLGPFGSQHFERIVRRLPSSPFPVLIQPVADPKLNEQRRQAIIERLAAMRIDSPEQRVVIETPQALPMYGIAAPGVARGYLGGNLGGGNNAGAQGGGAGMGGGGIF